MLKTYGAAAAAAFVVGFLSFGDAASAASVMKECGDQWNAAKAANQIQGQTWQDFLKTCRARLEGAAAPTPASTPTMTPTMPPMAQPSPTPTPTPTKQAPAPKKTPAAATGAGEFAAEAEAKAHCPSDTVVWVNTKSHKYHYAGHRNYGATKQGAYMCEADAKAAGDAASKGETGPKQ